MYTAHLDYDINPNIYITRPIDEVLITIVAACTSNLPNNTKLRPRGTSLDGDLNQSALVPPPLSPRLTDWWGHVAAMKVQYKFSHVTSIVWLPHYLPLLPCLVLFRSNWPAQLKPSVRLLNGSWRYRRGWWESNWAANCTVLWLFRGCIETQ